MLTQNRVAIAEAKLPEEVKRQGVTVKKKSPMILLCVNLLSPDGRYDQLYLSNYATIQVKDALARLPGVGDVSFLGARDYSMRVWLDPTQLAARSMTASDVVNALREQNVQVAAGRIGQPPAPAGLDFQYTINTLGRLLDPEQFAQIVLKTGEKGQITRLADVGRVELGAKSYDVSSFLDGQPSVTLARLPAPRRQRARDRPEHPRRDGAARQRASRRAWSTGSSTTPRCSSNESVHEVYKTLTEAFILVFLVVLIFLQDWRATLLPMIDVPVSLIGTLAVMSVLGFSLNNLSLFGLVLAIGIVVDDAIVVVENVERWMAQGLPPRDATIKALDEITGPVIAITLVLSSVFIPTAFIPGISGQFYRQFALTIAAATIISAINAMTMAPARAVTLIKPPCARRGASRGAPARRRDRARGVPARRPARGSAGGAPGTRRRRARARGARRERRRPVALAAARDDPGRGRGARRGRQRAGESWSPRLLQAVQPILRLAGHRVRASGGTPHTRAAVRAGGLRRAHGAHLVRLQLGTGGIHPRSRTRATSSSTSSFPTGPASSAARR